MSLASLRLRTLLALAWPVVLARATQAVVGFTDALMVAPLGENALAAVTTGAIDTFAIIMLPLGTVFILQTFAAQLRGRGDLESVQRYAWYGLLIALGAGVLAAAAIPLVPRAVSLLHFAPEVAHPMATFISIRLTGIAAIVGMEALGNWYAGLGNTRLSMICGVITMIANVLGNYLLIEPRFGLPGLGPSGAAIASTAASWLGFAVAAAAFRSGLGYQRCRAPLRLSARELFRVLQFGLPNGVNWFLEFAAFPIFINVVVAHMGTSALAAMNVVTQINSISFMPAFGVASAGAILVGEAIGAGRNERVWPIVRLTLCVSCGWMASAGVMYFLMPRELLGLFASPDTGASSLLTTGTIMLSVSAFWQAFDASAMTFSEALRAAGDTAWCMKVRLVSAWCVFTPLQWYVVVQLGAGVLVMMICFTAQIVVLSCLFAGRFASGRWRNIELLEGSPLPR